MPEFSRSTTDSDSSCVFCRIIAGTAACSRVYADETCLAFMDLHQRSPGHVLVAPRRHVEQIYDLDEDTAAHLAVVVLHIARAVRDVFLPMGLRVQQNNGEAAGQSVFHVHWHAITREAMAHPLERAHPTRHELDVLAGMIREALPARQAGGFGPAV